MTSKTKQEVTFDILLKGATSVSASTPQVETIDRFKPSPEIVEECRRELMDRGVTCYATDFGLACSAPVELFEKLFQVALEPVELQPGRPEFEMSSVPVPPESIAEQIDQITITAVPELF